MLLSLLDSGPYEPRTVPLLYLIWPSSAHTLHGLLSLANHSLYPQELLKHLPRAAHLLSTSADLPFVAGYHRQ